jgi:hypothetical protein
MASRLMTKVRNSFRQGGVVGTLKRVGNRIYVKVLDQSPARRRARRLKEQQDRDFDKQYNVETAGFMPLDRLAIGSANSQHGFAYDPIEPEKFQRTVGSLPLRYEDFIFIDFGSGKGKSVLLASELPFKKIIGVEFSPDLHRVSQRNVQTYRNDNQKCKDIEFVCMDAATYPLPPVPLVLFFFNPFGQEVMARVIDNVTRSYAEHPRELFVFYATPVLDELWAQVPFLVKAMAQPGYFAAYTTRDRGEKPAP